MSKVIPIVFIAFMLAGGLVSSCKHPTSPIPDTTKKKCDTCSDTTHKPCDTCNKPCDTCNLNKDSLAHAFTWKELTGQIPGETNLTGVWVFGPNDIIIVANSLWHYDGTSFAVMPVIRNGTNTPLNGALNGNNIFALSKTEFWLVHGSIAYHTTDGEHFDDIRQGNANACWGSAPNDIFIVGNGGHIGHFDGTKFSDMTSNTTKDIGQVWGTNGNNVWASGFNQSTAESVLLHYDGSSWTVIDLSKLGNIHPGGDGLVSVWTTDSSNHHITVAAGSFVYRTLDNSLWHSETLQNALGGGGYAALNQIRGNSSTDFMIQGAGGFLSHWNGKTWYFYNQLFNFNSDHDIMAFSYNGNTACMVGFKGGTSYVAIGTRKQ